MPAQSFSGVVLAGGSSRRMGRDKALLRIPAGRTLMPLWRRQYELLRSLCLDQVSISDRSKTFYPKNLRLIPDRWAERGPLGGIATCLACCQTDFLLVVAVDLPHLSPAFLRGLIAGSAGQQGRVPFYGGHFEPLAAVYPRTALAIAEEMLSGRQNTLQVFVSRLEEQGLVGRYDVAPGEGGNLANWNYPGDVVWAGGDTFG